MKFQPRNTARAKLTAQQVREIKAKLAEKCLQKVLAYEYGVSRSTIGGIARGAHWVDTEEEKKDGD